MPKGGYRGGGRPRGEPKVSVCVRLSCDVAAALRAVIPEKRRSEWIEFLIMAALPQKF